MFMFLVAPKRHIFLGWDSFRDSNMKSTHIRSFIWHFYRLKLDRQHIELKRWSPITGRSMSPIIQLTSPLTLGRARTQDTGT